MVELNENIYTYRNNLDYVKAIRQITKKLFQKYNKIAENIEKINSEQKKDFFELFFNNLTKDAYYIQQNNMPVNKEQSKILIETLNNVYAYYEIIFTNNELN